MDAAGGRLIKLPGPASTVFVADPAIADVQTPNPGNVFVFGKKTGRTTLFALRANGTPLGAWVVDVRNPQTELSASQAGNAANLPSHLGYTQSGAVLTGQVPSPAAAQRLHDLAVATVGPATPLADQLAVAGAVQVNLQVRVAEVDRTVLRQLGFNWSAAFSVGSFAFGLETGRLTTTGATLIGNGIDGLFGTVNSAHANGSAVIDAMASEGLVSMLAEPNLTAISGATAQFLAGGEIPLPVPQGLGVTAIEYKSFGVSVSFSPTVLSTGRISLKVRPEASELDMADAVTINGSAVPALTTRRAETTVELASGQSFAIAGLIQNNVSNTIQKVPWLGDLPVLGALFRSAQFQRNETELVIAVTPYVVRPADTKPADPTTEISVPSDLQELLFGRAAAASPGAATPVSAPRLRGSAGFLFE